MDWTGHVEWDGGGGGCGGRAKTTASPLETSQNLHWLYSVHYSSLYTYLPHVSYMSVTLLLEISQYSTALHNAHALLLNGVLFMHPLKGTGRVAWFFRHWSPYCTDNELNFFLVRMPKCYRNLQSFPPIFSQRQNMSLWAILLQISRKQRYIVFVLNLASN